MDNREITCSGPAVVLAFLGGPWLEWWQVFFSPRSPGKKPRELKGYARKAEEEVLEKAKEARAALDETIERGKHFIAEKTADAEAAVKPDESP